MATCNACTVNATANAIELCPFHAAAEEMETLLKTFAAMQPDIWTTEHRETEFSPLDLAVLRIENLRSQLMIYRGMARELLTKIANHQIQAGRHVK